LSLRLTLPIGMDLLDWSAQITFELDPYAAIGKLERVEDWQDWAATILNNASLNPNFPNPYDFDHWRDWAERFCRSGGS
jgi:hypothetical protein